MQRASTKRHGKCKNEEKGGINFVNFTKKLIETKDEDLYVAIPKLKLNAFASMKAKSEEEEEEKNEEEA